MTEENLGFCYGCHLGPRRGARRPEPIVLELSHVVKHGIRYGLCPRCLADLEAGREARLTAVGRKILGFGGKS